MENTLFRIFEGIQEDSTASLFVTILIAWFTVAFLFLLVGTFRTWTMTAAIVRLTPNTLSAIGVLGTFTGILIGLLDFDISDIDQSVEGLLEGLKIAFATSIVGLAGSILFRLVVAIIPARQQSDDIGADDIHAVLTEIRDKADASQTKSEEQLTALCNAISSDGDSSLLTQVQKMRTTLQDGQNELISEFKSFAEHMVENNQKAIIEALETVIKDFNDNLTEQFGENFKELNSAVAALVDWQEKYKDHVTKYEERIDVVTASMEATETAMGKITEHTEKVPEALAPLEPVLAGLEGQLSSLDTHLEALAGLRDRAIEAFPFIEENLKTVTSQFSESATENVAAMRESVKESKASYEVLRQSHTKLIDQSSDAQQSFSTELEKTMSRLTDQAINEFQKHEDLISQASEKAQTSINESWAQSTEKLNENFENFDKSMQDELTRAIELLGQNLASVSEKLVDDYTPLTQKLQKLVANGGSV
ncbi:hypothetical protein [Pseudophaeobacter sp. EL27]|uniref:hypothetical protein n=1 Tax=Pseudophaeobacter sp. EL27 TaxID=2107580 RepID=UPI000EFA414C|nr:hypothetical protein [Pseudophaeobacter sp. EL27]